MCAAVGSSTQSRLHVCKRASRTLSPSFPQEDGTGAKLIDCWCKGQRSACTPRRSRRGWRAATCLPRCTKLSVTNAPTRCGACGLRVGPQRNAWSRGGGRCERADLGAAACRFSLSLYVQMNLGGLHASDSHANGGAVPEAQCLASNSQTNLRSRGYKLRHTVYRNLYWNI